MGANREVKVIGDTLEFIRAKPRMFFVADRPAAWELVSLVLHDAADFPNCAVEVLVEAPFVLIVSDVNWMQASGKPPDRLFAGIEARPHAGPNLFRAEVFIRAFADGVITRGSGGDFAVGLAWSDLPARLQQKSEGAARSLAWRMA